MLTVWRISRLEHGRMNIRSGTFLARLDTSVVRYNTVLEGGVEFSIPCDDHVKGDDGDDGR